MKSIQKKNNFLSAPKKDWKFFLKKKRKKEMKPFLTNVEFITKVLRNLKFSKKYY